MSYSEVPQSFGPNGQEVRDPELRVRRAEEYDAAVSQESIQILAAEIDRAIEDGFFARICSSSDDVTEQLCEAVYPGDNDGRLLSRIVIRDTYIRLAAAGKNMCEKDVMIEHRSADSRIRLVGRVGLSLSINMTTGESMAYSDQRIGDERTLDDSLYIGRDTGYGGRVKATEYDLQQWFDELDKAQELAAEYGINRGSVHWSQ